MRLSKTLFVIMVIVTQSALCGETVQILQWADVLIRGVSEQENIGIQVASAGDLNNDGIQDLYLGTDQGGFLPYINFAYFLPGNTVFPHEIILNNPPEGTIRVTDFFPEVPGSCIGDFNGDGIDDFVIGDGFAYSETLLGGGRAFILFGSSSLPNEFSMDNPGVPGVMVYGHMGYGWLGNKVSGAGDINGDGFNDVILAANGRRVLAERREAYIIYGGTDVPSILRTDDLGEYGVRLVAETRESGFASDVAGVGDVNGDGLDDIFIGASKAEEGEDNAYLVYGATDLPAFLNIGDLGTRGVHILGPENRGRFGDYVAGVGDLDGDGLQDFMTSAWGNDVDGVVDMGKVYVFFGSRDFPSEISVEDIGTYGFEILGGVEDGFFGESLAGPGNLNKDAYNDLLIGSFRHPQERVNIIFGSPNLRELKSVRIQDLDRITITDTGFNRFGLNAAFAGDVNHDSWQDIVVGDPISSGESTAGTAYLIFGSEERFGSGMSTATPTPTITPTETSPIEPTRTPTPTLTPQNNQGFSGWILSGEGEVKKTTRAETQRR